jgi:crotonobetainyl-CoA:carnitine CoA-transferase CaiB-like acyl-CoA transferase
VKAPPLRGIRVIEQGQLLAVPFAARLLADLGAEVVKIESAARLDTHRQITFPDNRPGDAWWDRSGTFASENRGKLGMVLDLRVPAARDVFRGLICTADVLMENYTPRVMRSFELDYPRLAETRPGLIMLSSTGYGHTGPWANYTAVGPTTEAASGLAALTGYRDGPPVLPDIPYTDYVAAEQAVFAVLLALYRRRRTGAGCWIDLAQTEAQSAITSDLLLEAVTATLPAAPRGNRRRSMSPHGFFPCAGGDRWIAISVQSDADWQALCHAMGGPKWSADARFATLEQREANEDELEQRISSWTRSQDAQRLMRILQERGVAAGAVNDSRDLLQNEQLRSRGFFEWFDHAPQTGIGPKPYAGVPWHFSDSSRGCSLRAPGFGEHNTFILRDLLGYTSERIAGLSAAGALGSGSEAFRRPDPVPLEELQRKGYVHEYDPLFDAVINELDPDPRRLPAGP